MIIDPPPPLSTSAPSKELVATYVYFSSLYFVSVGVLHLWGYWTTFSINILEFLGLADIIKLTAYPVATALMATALGAVLGTVASHTQAARNSQPNERSLSVRVFLAIRKHRVAVFTAYIAVTVLFAFFAPAWKWLVLPVLLASPLVPYLAAHPITERVLPNLHVRVSVVLCIMAMLPTAYGTGRLSAEKILSGERFYYVVSIVEGVNADSNMLETERLRYLGHAGDFVFFKDPKGSTTVITKIESGKSLILKYFAKPDERFLFGLFEK